MSEGIITALINATFGLIGTIIGALITAVATVIVGRRTAEPARSQSLVQLQEHGNRQLWKPIGIIVLGGVIGCVVGIAFKSVSESLATPTSFMDDFQVIYVADLTGPNNWPERPEVKVSDGRLVFTPLEFGEREVWAEDFSRVLGDFAVSATIGYDRDRPDFVSGGIVVGPSSTDYFDFSSFAYEGDTGWDFSIRTPGGVSIKTGTPATRGQKDKYSVMLVRRGDHLSAYVDGTEIKTRTDIIFQGSPGLMRVGVKASPGSSISLEKLTVAVPKQQDR
jgi:hypothetical protein